MATRSQQSQKSRASSALGTLVVGLLVLGVLWFALWATNHPIAQIVVAYYTGIISGKASGNEPTVIDSPVQFAPLEQEPSEATGQALWDCFYEPTINDNWHDDVLCTNGAESERPILLPGEFVTQSDMEIAGAEYEATLNQGR